MAFDLDDQLANLDKVPEALREFYAEGDDDDGNPVFKLNRPGVGKKLANFARLLGEKKKLGEINAANTKLLGERSLEDVLKRLEELETGEGEKQDAAALKKGDFDKLKTKMEEEHAAETTKLAEQIEELDAALQVALIDTQATIAINALEGKVKPLLPHVRDAVDLVRLEDGSREVRVKDPDSDGYRSSIQTGEFMTTRELLEEMADEDDFAPLFGDNSGAGSGAPPKSGTGSPGPFTSAGKIIMLTQEQAKDVATYRNAKAEAAKTGAEVQIAEP